MKDNIWHPNNEYLKVLVREYYLTTLVNKISSGMIKKYNTINIDENHSQVINPALSLLNTGNQELSILLPIV